MLNGPNDGFAMRTCNGCCLGVVICFILFAFMTCFGIGGNG